MSDTNDDLLDINLDDVETIREHADGKYAGNIMGYTAGKNKNGTPYVDLEFQLDTPLEDQDMTGVSVAKRLRMRLWISEKAFKRSKKSLADAGVNVEGRKLREVLDELEGAAVEAVVETSDTDWKEVTRFKLAA